MGAAQSVRTADTTWKEKGMKLATFNDNRLGVVTGDSIVDISAAVGVDPASWPPVGMVGLIGAFDRLKPAIEAAVEAGPRLPLSSVTLQCPIAWPSKIVAYHVNFDIDISKNRLAAGAVKAAPGKGPGFFLKAPSALSGPSDTIVLPDMPGREIIHECELGIILGRGGREISRETAMDHVFGYTCLVDMVALGQEERVMRKGFDTFCPVGPWIATVDEIPDPRELEMELSVNGEVRQQAKLSELLLDIPGMIALASSIMTLEPGDIIASGTPPGVGLLVGGDRLRISIPRIGEMNLDVIQGRAGRNSYWD
jgi:2-keto-4-pentenoate hydratase/2-oxohepta-3-ene-1,7-dioic acid hydratase in catechol pathway